MSIGSIGNSGGGSGQLGFHLSIKSDNLDDLKKAFSSIPTGRNAATSQTNSQQSQQGGPGVGGPAGGPPPGGFPGGQPPSELSTSDLSKIKDAISKSGGQGADKIDDLIKNFSQYDKNGTGKISIQDFKSYAQQNGVELPKPPVTRSDYNQALPSSGSVTQEESSSAKSNRSAVSGLLDKYAASASDAQSSTHGASTSAVTSTQSASTSGQTGSAKGSQSSQGSSDDLTQKSDADLEKLAKAGNTKAQEELNKRKAAAKAKEKNGDDKENNNQGKENTAVSKSVNVEA